ncbi:MAG: hypothetical protein K1X81_13040 [Bacteroidia bacterium]|nr:hypothetical protein [Bacteroidia bacterium]
MNNFKAWVCLIYLAVLPFLSMAQKKFGFEWIRPGQTYYRFTLTANGVYRIDYATLVNSGISPASIDPRKIQLFQRGEELPVFINGESDSSFDQGDFIEFYALKNDGFYDKKLYLDSTNHYNPYVSFVSDTACVFFTVNPQPVTAPLRLVNYSNTNYGSFTAEPYFMKKQVMAFATAYYYGIPLIPSDDYHSSEYLMGEGWASGRYGKGLGKLTASFNTATYFTGGPASFLKVRMSGVSDYDPINPDHHHVFKISPDQSVFTTVFDTVFEGYTTLTLGANLSSALIGTSYTYFELSNIDDQGSAVDAGALAFSELTFPSFFNLQNSTFLEFTHSSNSSASDVLLSFTNYSGNAPVLYDLTGKNRISGFLNLTNAKFLYKKNAGENSLVVFDTADVKKVNQMEVVGFSVIDTAVKYDYLIVTNKLLLPKATEYAQYRSSKYTVLLVTTEQLSNYYTYGINHPLAVRNFADHLLTSGLNPKFLVLIGRGLQHDYVRLPQHGWLNLVPQLGVPSSDNMFTSGLNGTLYEPAIPTGRIPAITNQDIDNYLQKVKSMETTPDSIQFWRKHIVHLGGGEGASQQNSIAYTLNENKKVAEAPLAGASVTSYFKSTTNPVDVNLKQAILTQINQGLNVLTFFGHGSLNILDIDIGKITDLTNKDKYPLMYFNGCNVGNISADITGGGSGVGINGATYINTANAGAISWIAHSNTSKVSFLDAQITGFYRNTFSTNYGASVGEIMKKSIQFSQINGNEESKSHSAQMILLGDPAIHLYTPSLSEYEVTNQDVFFTPSDFSAVSDSFAFSAIVKNKAKATGNDLQFRITRTLPGGAKQFYTFSKEGGVNYIDTVSYYIKSKDITTVGFNQFDFQIDPDELVNEYSKSNNSATVTIFVPGNSLNLLAPLPYSIVNTTNIVLVAQGQNLFSDAEDFEMEIDTSPVFNPLSPFYQNSGTLKTSGALARWNLTVASTDSVVYFWRARLKKPIAEGGNWNSSSFVYIKNGVSGWSQSNFNQFKSGTFTTLVPDTMRREFNYTLTGEEISLSTARWRHGGLGIKFTTSQPLTPFVGGCILGGIVGMVIDKKTLNYDLESRYPYNCQYVIDYNNSGAIYPARINYYTFQTELASGRKAFTDFIDTLDDRVYAVFFTRYNSKPSVWDESMYKAFEKIGSGQIRNVTNDSMSFVIIGDKSLPPGGATETYIYNPYFGTGSEQNLNDTIVADVRKILTYFWYEGSVVSPLIGPSVSWNKAFIRTSQNETVTSDSFAVDILVITKDGQDSVYYSQIRPDSIDLTAIPATLFPYIKLRFYTFDKAFRTPLHLNYWQVLYQPPPEGFINTKVQYSFYKSGIEEGDSIQVNYAFQNITSQAFDSLYVRYSVVDANRVEKVSLGKVYPPIAPFDTLLISEKLATIGLSGANLLTIQVNKDMEQPEQNLANNLITIPYLVKTDKVNPLLDVYFDGIRIMNGDIVSPSPHITVVMKDENRFLKLTDTSGAELFLKRPGSADFEYIPFTSSQIQFISANGSGNESKIIYSPVSLTDGLYTLKVVSKDRSGNRAGSKPYVISFNVINESAITHFIPYPNPCTNSMRFVFTVTGAQAPDQILVKIMTVTGKVVREISAAEFGPVHIGNNTSQFVWDGTDQYGDRLANGVYLYQVQARANGVAIKHRSSEMDKYFSNNTGKIYLMR